MMKMWAAGGFDWQLPAHFNFAGDVVDHWARNGDPLALIALDEQGGEERLHFSDFARLSSRLAAGLTANGIAQGDRVIVMFPRRPEWQVAQVACLRIGAVPIPCIEMLTSKDIAYRVRHSGARGVVTMSRNIVKFTEVEDLLVCRIAVGGGSGWLDYGGLIRKGPDHLEPALTAIEDPAIIYYTSGSTGNPKGVTHAARTLFAWRQSARTWLDLRPGDLIWCTADTGWAKAGTSILFGPWSLGVAALFYDGGFDPAVRLRLIELYKVTVYCAPATELYRIVAHGVEGRDLRLLRRTVSAGEAVSSEIAQAWRSSTGLPIAEAYGQTESLMTVGVEGVDAPMPGSMGKALSGCELAVMDTGRKRAPLGEVGNLAIRMPNPQMMLGYWDDPERTTACYITVGSDPWYITGDLAREDEEGNFYFAGRDDDIINSSGYRIGPFEVESALMAHSAVLECAAVASPDAQRGEVVKAFVVLVSAAVASDALVDELQQHVRATTAPYKYPRKIEFVDELPKTLTGKILRRELRQREFALVSTTLPESG